MADDPLKIRFSRWVHNDRYRYSLPATAFKFGIEIAFWGLLVALPVLFVASTAGFGNGVTGTQLATPGSTWLFLLALAMNKQYCKTTVPRDEL